LLANEGSLQQKLFHLNILTNKKTQRKKVAILKKIITKPPAKNNER